MYIHSIAEYCGTCLPATGGHQPKGVYVSRGSRVRMGAEGFQLHSCLTELLLTRVNCTPIAVLATASTSLCILLPHTRLMGRRDGQSRPSSAVQPAVKQTQSDTALSSSTLSSSSSAVLSGGEVSSMEESWTDVETRVSAMSEQGLGGPLNIVPPTQTVIFSKW